MNPSKQLKRRPSFCFTSSFEEGRSLLYLFGAAALVAASENASHISQAQSSASGFPPSAPLFPFSSNKLMMIAYSLHSFACLRLQLFELFLDLNKQGFFLFSLLH